MGCASSKQNDQPLTVHVETTHAFSDQVGGDIKIQATKDVRCEWTQNGNAALLQLSTDRRCAKNVPPGTYSIECVGSEGEIVNTDVEIRKIPIPCVSKYTVEHATHDLSRDGQVTAEIEHLNTENVRFLWTSGIVTDTPLLRDVRPGLYSVTPVSKEKIPVLFYHCVPPAEVKVLRNDYEELTDTEHV